MIDLDNKIWQQLHGGYKIPYDASVPLRKLEGTNEPKKIKEIFEELWNGLHHKGDVGLASYLAVPQLVRIASNKKLFDWNIFGLCTVIEIQRHAERNPTLPLEFERYYDDGLKNLKDFVLTNIKSNEMDNTTYISALSVLAVTTGRIKLGKAIIQLEDESVLDEFLESFQ